jgi:hypothetical protein
MCMDPIRTRVHSEIQPYAVIQSPNPALCCDSDSLKVRVRGYAMTRSPNPAHSCDSQSRVRIRVHTARFFASRAARGCSLSGA